MSTEDTNRAIGERRRRRLESARAVEPAQPAEQAQPAEGVAREDQAGATATGSVPLSDPSTTGATLSRRQLREARQREEEARRAARQQEQEQEKSPTPAAPTRVARAERTASLPPVSPARVEDAAEPTADEDSSTPSGRTPNRRSVREHRVEGPAGPAGRGERVPAQRPVVRTPLAAQGVRRLDETGALSGVTSTRATDDSPVEVTGPIDWSSSLDVAAPVPAAAGAPVVPPSPAESADPVEPDPPVVPPRTTTPPTPPVTPPRRSVLAGSRQAPHAWESVTGDGRGAVVPRPEDAEVPDVEGVFAVAPDALELEPAEGIDVGSDDGGWPAWITWPRIALVAAGSVLGGLAWNTWVR